MTPGDIIVGTATVWAEARNQGREGMAAVAAVLLERVRDGRWGSTLVDVCMAPYQFSCWNTKDPNRRMAMKAVGTGGWKVAQDALMGQWTGVEDNPVPGANHYLNPRAVNGLPEWAQGREPDYTIGDHDFYCL